MELEWGMGGTAHPARLKKTPNFLHPCLRLSELIASIVRTATNTLTPVHLTLSELYIDNSSWHRPCPSIQSTTNLVEQEGNKTIVLLHFIFRWSQGGKWSYKFRILHWNRRFHFRVSFKFKSSHQRAILVHLNASHTFKAYVEGISCTRSRVRLSRVDS